MTDELKRGWGGGLHRATGHEPVVANTMKCVAIVGPISLSHVAIRNTVYTFDCIWAVTSRVAFLIRLIGNDDGYFYSVSCKPSET